MLSELQHCRGFQGVVTRSTHSVARLRRSLFLDALECDEVPLKPSSRAGLQHAKEMAQHVAHELGTLGRSVDLPAEAPSDEVSESRAMLERNGCVFRNSQ